MRERLPRLTPSRLILLGIVVIGGALRFTDLGDQSFWADEVYTTQVLGESGFWGLPHRVHITEVTPPPYYMLAWIWARAFGSDEVGLRSLSAFLGTATIPVFYLAVRELSSRRAGLIAAALCACSPLLVWYSQEARSYALYVFLVVLSFWLFARALKDPRMPNLIAWGVGSAVLISSYYLAGGLVLLEGAALLWFARDRRKQVAVALAVPVATSVAWLPYALGGIKPDWIGRLAPLGDRASQALELFLVGNSDPATIVVIAVAAIVIAAGIGIALGGSPDDRRAWAIAVLLGLLSLLALAAGGILDADYFLGRNVIFAWVPLAAASAIALAWPRLRTLGPLAAALICATGIWLVLEVKRDDALQRVDYRTAAELIGEPPASGYRTIVVPGLFLSKSLPLYLDGIAPSTYFPPPSFEVVQLGYAGSDRGPHNLCWWGGACGLSRDPVYQAPPGFKLVERSSSGLWTLTRFRTERPRVPVLPPAPGAVILQQGG